MSWGVRMQYKTIGEINHYASENVNPARFPEQYFELYSVPHFSEGHPEIIKGKDVGATKQVVQEGDVLICKINPRINRVWKVTRHTDYPLIASSEWVIVRNADLNADYLTYYFSSPKFRVLINSELTGMGGSLTRAQPKQIRRYSVPVPDKEEQHFVVRNLALLDHLISLRQQQAEKLDELVKARFVEMFGDPVRNTKQFPLVEVQDLYDVSSSKRVYQDEMVLDGIPFLRISDIVEKSTNDKCTPQCFISQEMYDQLSQKGLTPNVGDILVTSRGTLGLCYEVKPGEKFYFQDGMISWLYNRKDCVINTYLLYAFRMPGIRKQIDGSNDGSTVSYLSIARLKRLKIELPPLALQTEFSHFVHEVDREKERIQRSAALLETLKRSLMQQYFG